MLHNNLSVLIVDDDQGMHMISRLLIRGMTFQGKKVALISAHSIEEARQQFAENQDVSVAVINAPEGQIDQYIQLIRHLRHTLKLKELRIILSIVSYKEIKDVGEYENLDINDLRTINELTEENFAIVVRTALRDYLAEAQLTQHISGLHSLISDLSAEVKVADHTLYEVLKKIESIMGRPEGNSKLVIEPNADWNVVFSEGQFSGLSEKEIFEGSEELIELVKKYTATQTNYFLYSNDKVFFSLNMIANQDALCCIFGCERAYQDSYTLGITQLFTTEYSLKIRNERLQKDLLMSHRHVLTKLCESVEVRSPETGKHIYRIGMYAALFSKILGFDEEYQILIEHAAPLHDIGKIAIPDVILMKPGKLTTDEFETMKTHVIHGFNFFKRESDEIRPLLDLAAVIALTHHEKWDGSGYPNQTSGIDIPIAGRIVALCDVFDALRSKRCYKEPVTLKETLRIMQKDAGTHFDPKLMKIFAKHHVKFDQIFLDNIDHDANE